MKNIILAVFRSPILRFVILGFAVFMLYVNLKPPGREMIHVTTQTIDALVLQHESITLNPVTPEERQQIITGHIEDEILLREAYKRAFDKNDYWIRKRILNIMCSSLSEVIPEPSVAQLRAFYDENRESFLTSPSRTFEQVHFFFTSTRLPDDPGKFIQELQGLSDISSIGEYSPLGTTFSTTSFQQAASIFGKPFAQVVFELPIGEWRGPVESFRGIHYVRVTASHDPELPPFESMEHYIRNDYFIQKSRESLQRKIDDLRENYEIIIEGVETKK